MNRILQCLASAALCAVVIASTYAAPGELGFSRSVTPGLIVHFERLFGRSARGQLEGWKNFVRGTGERAGQGRGVAGEGQLLGLVNGFFNRLPYVSDQVQWGAVEHWATPAEFQGSGGGDCEDYAFGKYFTLKELGVPVSRLRMVYARTWKSAGAHMVLAYYSAPGADPLILDSLEGSIRPASDRPDLIPVYTFNDDDLLFPQPGQPTLPISTASVRLWRVVLDKLARELTY